MKKLIIAMAIAVMAVASQAATTQWGSGTITAHATGKTAGAGAVTMYIFSITQDDYNSMASKSGETLSKYIYANYTTGDAYKSADTGVKGGAASASSTTETWEANQALYTAVLFVDNTDGYVAGNVATITTPSSGKASFQNLFTKYGGTAESGTVAWAAVPEPTSGLLLLLGMAGLALKRKRA